MSRLHFPSDIEQQAVVFYLPEVQAFWTGKRRPPGRLRQAVTFHFQVPPPPRGAICLPRRKAKLMLSRGDHARFLQYAAPDDREFYERVTAYTSDKPA